MRKTFRHVLTVRGIRYFPIDMLRYDGCIPYSEEEAGKIIRTFGPYDERDSEIRVYKITESKISPWTLARWESFGWKKVKEDLE